MVGFGKLWVVCSGVRRKFLRGAKFRHNCVTPQINFRGNAEGTTILGGPGACPRENYAFLCIMEASFRQYSFHIFLFLGSEGWPWHSGLPPPYASGRVKINFFDVLDKY